MALVGVGIDIWTPSVSGGSRINLPPGQAILFSRGQATVSFVSGALQASTLSAAGVATVAFVGFSTGGGGGTTGQPIGLLLALTYS